MYCDHFNKIENLWYEFERGSINETKAQKKFYIIMNEEKEMNRIVNEIIKNGNNKIQIKAEINSSNYFNNIFNQNRNE